MKIPLYEQASLLKDYPEEGLVAGDVVTTVDFLESPKLGIPNGYFVEAFNALGKTVAVFTVYEDDIVALTDHDMWHVRSISQPTQTIQILDEYEATGTKPLPTVEPILNSISVELPDELLKQTGVTREEAKLKLSIALFQEDFFSLGKASEFAGLHPSQFQKELAKRQISVHYDEDDYQHDLNTIDDFTKSSLTYHEV